jgi:hypothetical protein
MASTGFELAILAIKRLQTYVLDRTATRSGLLLYISASHFAQMKDSSAQYPEKTWILTIHLKLPEEKCAVM